MCGKVLLSASRASRRQGKTKIRSEKQPEKTDGSMDSRFVNAQLQPYDLANLWQAGVDRVWIGDIVHHLFVPVLLAM